MKIKTDKPIGDYHLDIPQVEIIGRCKACGRWIKDNEPYGFASEGNYLCNSCLNRYSVGFDERGRSCGAWY